MTMTPAKFRAIREKLKLTQCQMAQALGYNDANANISRFETGERKAKLWIIRLMLMFERHGVPSDFL